MDPNTPTLQVDIKTPDQISEDTDLNKINLMKIGIAEKDSGTDTLLTIAKATFIIEALVLVGYLVWFKLLAKVN